MDSDITKHIADTFPEFLRRCTRGHAVVDAVAAEYSLPSYLLGLMNTAYLSAERWPITEAALREANPGSERSRFGAEHWAVLVTHGLAVPMEGGWALTPQGSAIVLRFHRSARDEVARRHARRDVIVALHSAFARAAEGIPSSHKIEVIRQLWQQDSVDIVALYRTIWELYLYRRVVTDDRYFRDWPRGEDLRSLAEGFAVLVRDLR